MSSADKVLVTGASGFIGSAVARALLQRGYRVRVLVRPTSPRFHLQDLDLEFVEGDMRDAPSVRRAMDDVRYVCHVAADYRLWARHPCEIIENNVVGTRNVMDQACCAGVERIVYTSSIATLTRPGEIADETTPLAECDAIGPYKRSKVIAEKLVASMAAEKRLPVVIVNPTTPLGPRDVRPTPTGRIVVETAAGRMPGYIDTGLNLIHVDDVASGHVAALEHGRIGERYVLGGQNVQLVDLLTAIAREAGIRSPRMRMLRLAVYPAAFAAEAVARLTGREPFITVDGLRMAKNRMFANSAKAERELHLTPRPYTEGVADAVRWFHDAGYLSRRR